MFAIVVVLCFSFDGVGGVVVETVGAESGGLG